MAAGGGGLTEKWGGRVPAKGRREGIMTVKGAGLAGLMRFWFLLVLCFLLDQHGFSLDTLYASLCEAHRRLNMAVRIAVAAVECLERGRAKG